MQKAPKLLFQTNVFLLRMVFALFLSMIAQMIPIFQEMFTISLDKTGLFMTFQSFGGVVCVLIGAKLFDKYDKRYILLYAAAVFTVLVFIISSIPPLSILFLLLALIGCSNGAIDTLTNAITGENFPENRSVFINLLHVFFGIGAITGPFFCDVLFKLYGIRQMFKLFGILLIVICVAYFITLKLTGKKIAKFKEYEEKKETKRFKLDNADKINLAKVCILTFLMAGATITQMTWSSLYTTRVFHLSSSIGALTLALFWGGKVFGMLSMAKLTKRLSAHHFIFYGSLFAGIIFAAGLMIDTPAAFITCTALTGLIFGNVEPQIMVLSMGYFPGKAGFAASVIAITASIGVMLVPYPVGLISEHFGLFYGLMCSSVAMLILALTSYLILRKKQNVKGTETPTEKSIMLN